ncbi:hypothetical protein RRG08_043550 [Elysia crispata]|uniref:Uncharacterized protein n=1 Tax=Elysia crispata TaxID=231223 RepID=A0AAE1CXX1_9GAST|nr:hypothetical protein RRG08_043550 [Elysia crispata]
MHERALTEFWARLVLAKWHSIKVPDAQCPVPGSCAPALRSDETRSRDAECEELSGARPGACFIERKRNESSRSTERASHPQNGYVELACWPPGEALRALLALKKASPAGDNDLGTPNGTRMLKTSVPVGRACVPWAASASVSQAEVSVIAGLGCQWRPLCSRLSLETNRRQRVTLTRN